MSFDDSQTAGKAYTAIHHEINRAIIEQTDKDDKHSKEIIESLKALREELKQAAIANRDTRIRDLPSGVRGQFTDVGKTIERLVREMPNKQDWQNFKNDLGQGSGSKLEERFGKNTVGGTAAQLAAGAVGSIFGVGGEAQFVIRAIQESTEALREVGTGIKFLTKTTVEGIKKTGDVLGTIGSFFDPRNPQGITGKLISGLSNILSGNSFLTPLLEGIATIIPKFLPPAWANIIPGGLAAWQIYQLMEEARKKYNIPAPPEGWWQHPFTPSEPGGVPIGPRSSLEEGASPVKFTDAGDMRLLSGGFGGTQSQAQKDERLIQLLAMQEQEDIHNVGRPQLAAYHPSDSSLGDIGTGMSTSSGGQSVSSGGQQKPFHPGIIPSILGLLSSRRRPGAKRGLGKFNQGFPFKGFFQTGGLIPPGGVGVVGEDGAERIEATPSGAMVIPMPRPRSGSGAPGSPLISEINKRAVFPHEGFVNPLTNPNVEQSVREKYANQKVPAGIRLNNPSGISDSIKWGGYLGPPRPSGEGGRYTQFNTPEEGLMAQGALLQDYILNRGQNTIEKVIWGPGGASGTKAQKSMGWAALGREEYVKNMSKMLGMDPKEEIQFSKEFQYRWTVAQSQHETGSKRPYTEETYARAAGIDPDKISQLAINAKDQSKPISGNIPLPGDERGDAKRAADERQHQDRQQNRRHPVHRHQRVAGDFDDPQVASSTQPPTGATELPEIRVSATGPGIPQGVVPIAGSKGQPGQLTNVSGSDLGIGVRDVGKGKPWPVVSTQKLLEKEARAGGFESAINTMRPGGKYSEDPIDWAGNVKNADVSNFPLSENIEDRRGEHFKSQPRWLGEKHMREEAMKASGLNIEKIRKEGEKHDLEVRGGGPKASDHQQDIHRLKNERDDAKRAANERRHQDRQQNSRQQNRLNVPVHRPQRVVGDFHLAMLTSGNPSG